MTDLAFMTIAEASRLIRGRKLSPVELTAALLARIAALDGIYHAYIAVTAETALAQAKAAEAEIAAGAWRGPLHGVPYALKDIFDVAGMATTCHSKLRMNHRAAADATVVTRLREAGAVLLGKCAMVEFAGGLGYRFANASSSGPGRNPWNTARWTGGSSSGSGAAVAARLAPFALGTETWGSILCPSAFCGLTGIRPTYGRVSRHGAMVCSWTFDKVGPLARSAADCRTVLTAIAGADPDDPFSADEPVDFARPRHLNPGSLKGAIVEMDFTVKGAEREGKALFDQAVAELSDAGLSLEPARLPDFPASEVAGLLITAEALSSFENFYRDGRVKQLKDAYAPWQPEINRALGGADIVKAWRMRRVLQEKMAEFFSRYDFIVTPNFLSTAPPIDKDLVETLPYADPVGGIGNACGLPAIALPCGFGRDRLPVGFQIMAAPFEEALLLDLGELYQSRTEFHLQRPALD